MPKQAKKTTRETHVAPKNKKKASPQTSHSKSKVPTASQSMSSDTISATSTKETRVVPSRTPRKQAQYQKKYRTQVLGYRKERSTQFQKVDTALRIAVIFEHAVHRKPVKQIIRDHQVNYSTLRHILIQFYLFGRVDVRKFRPGPALSTEALETRKQSQQASSAGSTHPINLQNCPQFLGVSGFASFDEARKMHGRGPRIDLASKNKLLKLQNLKRMIAVSSHDSAESPCDQRANLGFSEQERGISS